MVTAHDSGRVPPLGHPRINAWLPAPRGLSQAPTSFFGSWCQGIHPALLHHFTQHSALATPHAHRHHDDPKTTTTTAPARWQRLKMLASTVQFSNNNQHQHTDPRPRRGPAVLRPTSKRTRHHPPPSPPHHHRPARGAPGAHRTARRRPPTTDQRTPPQQSAPTQRPANRKTRARAARGCSLRTQQRAMVDVPPVSSHPVRVRHRRGQPPLTSNPADPPRPRARLKPGRRTRGPTATLRAG